MLYIEKLLDHGNLSLFPVNILLFRKILNNNSEVEKFTNLRECPILMDR